MNTAAYQNKTYQLRELLSMAEAGSIAIPNIQRPYVWSPAQLARYIDSLMHSWPCGSLLLWQTNRESQNIFGTRSFAHLHLTPAATPREEPPAEDSNYQYLILDGQQRMQSLVLAFSAQSEGYRATTHEWRRDMGSTGGRKNLAETRLLCFNLRGWTPKTDSDMPSFFYLDYEEDLLETTPCLQWVSEAEIEASGGAYIPLCRIPETSRQYPEALAWLKSVVHHILENTRISVLEINQLNHKVESLDDDEAIVQIFTRLNTAGTPLTKEQIQAARIKSLWPDFPERINTLLDDLSKAPYLLQLNTDDLVNGFNITMKAWYHSSDISSAYAQASSQNTWDMLWNRFAQYTKNCITSLQDKKMFCNAEYKSLYVLWFPVAHMCCRKTDINEDTAHQMVKWALVTTWAKIWANRSGQYVKSFTDHLIRSNEQEHTSQWLRNLLKESQLTKAACDTIDNLAASHRGSVRQYYLPLWAWTRLEARRAEFVLSFGSSTFAVDHIIPISWVSDANYKATFNSLGNCWMLSSTANSTKSNDSFKSFLKNYGLSTGENDQTTVQTIAGLLDCSEAHLTCDDYTRLEADTIAQRELRIKEDIKKYILEDIELAFPAENRIRQNDYNPDVNSIYKGDEYVRTIAFTRLGIGTRSSYLSHIRSAMSNLSLSKEKLSETTTQELQELLKNAGDQGNAAPGWRNYLRFICSPPEQNTASKTQALRPDAGEQRNHLSFTSEAPGTTLKQTPRHISVKSALNLHRGAEFIQSDFMKNMGEASIASYISNIRKVVGNLNINAEKIAEMTDAELQHLLDFAGEQNNCASAWRSYLNFLLNNEATPRASKSSNIAPSLNAADIYNFKEYEQSEEFRNMTLASQRCYITGIRGALKEFADEINPDTWTNPVELQKLADAAKGRLSPNYASYWRKYINFLLNKETSPRASRLSHAGLSLNAPDIYMFKEYAQSEEFRRMTVPSQRCYVTGIRGALKEFEDEIDADTWTNPAKLQRLADKARLRLSANYASYWRKYINFLLQQL